ncbi:hypothetical protein [Lysinibacillus sp. S1]
MLIVLLIISILIIQIKNN